MDAALNFLLGGENIVAVAVLPTPSVTLCSLQIYSFCQQHLSE